MQLNDFLNILNDEFPVVSVLDGDKVGLQVKGSSDTLSNVLIAYELTESVLNEAISVNAELIVVFHPLIFHPLNSINDEDRVGGLVRKLIISNISLFVIHTNFDTHPNGANNLIADKLGLLNRSILVQGSPEKKNSIGIIGYFKEVISNNGLAELLNVTFNSPVRYCQGKSEFVKSVAVLGGSGSSFLGDAIKSGADAFITADLSYHQFHHAKGRISLFDIGHYEMEQFNHIHMAEIIFRNVENFKINIIQSKVITNPVSYYSEKNYYENQKSNILNN